MTNTTTSTHYLEDWMTVHNLNLVELNSLLQAVDVFMRTKSLQTFNCRRSPVGIDALTAWDIARDSLTSLFPFAASTIRRVSQNTSVVILDKSDVPYTKDLGPGKFPEVGFSYTGTSGDLFAVVHEFSHACEIGINKGGTSPPLFRETSAFIGELALLNYVENAYPEIHELMRNTWEFENLKYLGTDSAALKMALTHPGIPYQYCWNYPLARFSSIELFANYTAKYIWSIFSKGLTPIFFEKLIKVASRGDLVSTLQPYDETNHSQPPVRSGLPARPWSGHGHLRAWRSAA